MALHKLTKLVRRSKRRGRGTSGRGGKSGRGMKGQKSRAGYSRKAGFEGGQTPLYMRLPKMRGSKQKFPSQVTKPFVITTRMLSRFPEGTAITPASLFTAGLTDHRRGVVKVIGNTKLNKKLIVRVHFATATARQQIEQAGGTIEMINA